MQLEQDLTVLDGGALTTQGSISFKGNIINNGISTFGIRSRLLAFGSSRQTIKGTASLFIPHFTLNNASGLQLQNPITITDSLKLTNGVLYTSALYPVTFSNSATNPKEWTKGYIDGRAIMETRGIGTNALDTFLGVSISSGSDIGMVNLIRNTGKDAVLTIPGNITSIAANWQINASNAAAATNRNISFSWLSSFDNAKDLKAMYLFAGTANLEKINRTGVDVSGSDPRMFTHSSIGSLNRIFSLFNSGKEVFQFIHFSGVRKVNGVQLNWTTGYELDNAGFEVERSVDGLQFEKIGFVKGKNSVIRNQYGFFDEEALNQGTTILYYRLKQLDSFGNYQYSPVIFVVLLNTTYLNFNIYPNPFVNIIKVDIEKVNHLPVTIRIVDVRGTVVFNKEYQIGKLGQIRINEIQHLAAGTYFISVVNGTFFKTVKIIKSHE